MKNKTLIIDWDDRAALLKGLSVIKSRLGELNISPKNQSFREVFDACVKLWETDISGHYKNRKLDQRPIYYVYSHMDTASGIRVDVHPKTTFAATLGMNCVPFYIGKGTGDRAFDLNRNETHRKIRQRLREGGKDISVRIIKDGITESQALALEDKLIDIFRLKIYGGFLTNLDEGYYPKQRQELYAEQYSLMVPGYRKHRGSTPLPSTTDIKTNLVSVEGGLTAIDLGLNPASENTT